MSFAEQQQTAYLDKMVTVRNLTDEMFSAKWGGEIFVLNPKSDEKVPMWLGKHLKRHGNANGKNLIEIVEDVKEVCGVCQAEFDTKRELGAHSIQHKLNKPQKQTSTKE